MTEPMCTWSRRARTESWFQTGSSPSNSSGTIKSRSVRPDRSRWKILTFAARCRAASTDAPTSGKNRTNASRDHVGLSTAHEGESDSPEILQPILHHGTIARGHFHRYELRCSGHVARQSAKRKSREADHAYHQHDDRGDSCCAFCRGGRLAGISATHPAERGSHRKMHRPGSPAMAGRGSRGASATRRVLQGLHDGGWPESMSRIGAG